MEEKREKFIKRLHEIDERFSMYLAWEDNYKTGKSTVLMTPATEFYRLYMREIKKMEDENEMLKDKLKKIQELSNIKQSKNNG